MRKFFSFLFILFFLYGSAQDNRIFPLERYPVIPRPQTLLPLAENFRFSSDVIIYVEEHDHEKIIKKETAFFRQQVESQYQFKIRHSKFVGYKSCIFIWLDSTGLPPEGYEMFINANDINIYGSRAGIFNALQTLFQLIQPTPNTFTELMIPACAIIDYPRFQWRGMHLDVSRHFFPKENVKDYLRYMAMYKLNTFHWHLTDDQGWRIEIKKYPLLTSVGAWRNATLIGHYSETPDRYDSTRYGGFYTQQEIKEVVRFADSLHITVVPEIEMPGHASALLTAYPNLGCDQTAAYKVEGTWGVFTHVLCPKEETFTALEGILDEVCALFPGRYIHIGGDECPKDEWKTNDVCQQLIRQNNLKDEHGLQGWFVQRIVTYLGTKGKKAIGWDEILEGGLADSAAVMSWRGEEGGVAAAKAHHTVVMAPGSHCYFDHYQSQSTTEPLAIGGYLPIEKVYSYDPVPASLSADEKKYIMGVQANLWTEYISSFSQVQYMLFPRIAAVAEVAWTHPSVKNFQSFVARIMFHMNSYRRMNVNYSRALFEVRPSYAPAPDGNGLLLSFSTYLPYADIRFNAGGLLTLGDSIYRGPILINRSQHITAGAFLGEEQLSPDFNRDFFGHKALGKRVTLRKAPSPSYNTGGALTLVDGNSGRSPWTGSEWLGWWGDTMDVVIDLGDTTQFDKIKIVTLCDSGSWIYFPDYIRMEFSNDGVHYEDKQPHRFYKPNGSGTGTLTSHFYGNARYIHIRLAGKKNIPEGSPGAGYPAWLFVSEIIVE